MTNPNRIDPLAPPPPLAPKPSIFESPWFRRLALGAAGAALAAACPFIPVPVVRAICVGVATVVSIAQPQLPPQGNEPPVTP